MALQCPCSIVVNAQAQQNHPSCGKRLGPWRLLNGDICNGGFTEQRRNAASSCLQRIPLRQHTRIAARTTASNPSFASSYNQEFEEEELKEDVESFSYLVNTVQCILHFKYQVGDMLDENDAKLIVEEVLRFHPKVDEKIGCGLESIMVSYHPEYNRSRCFIINRVDKSSCDFSYRKSMLGRAQMKGISMMVARKLLNMDYMDIAARSSL